MKEKAYKPNKDSIITATDGYKPKGKQLLTTEDRHVSALLENIDKMLESKVFEVKELELIHMVMENSKELSKAVTFIKEFLR